MSPTDRPQPFDAIIIGSGQAGGPLSHRLADRDWKVALIEREHLGDSCVNYGCTPTKRMLASARVAHAARDGARYDVHAADIRVDMAKIATIRSCSTTSLATATRYRPGIGSYPTPCSPNRSWAGWGSPSAKRVDVASILRSANSP